jgi:hypothetical protein
MGVPRESAARRIARFLYGGPNVHYTQDWLKGFATAVRTIGNWSTAVDGSPVKPEVWESLAEEACLMYLTDARESARLLVKDLLAKCVDYGGSVSWLLNEGASYLAVATLVSLAVESRQALEAKKAVS